MPRPNFLYIFMDDMRFDFLQFMPNIKARVARFGRTYTNAQVQSAVCPTSRFSTISGRGHYAHNDGGTVPPTYGSPAWSYQRILDGNVDLEERAEHDDNIAWWLHNQRGYKCAMIGKYMNYSTPRNPSPRGWTWWREAVGDDSYSRLGVEIQTETAAVLGPYMNTSMSQVLVESAQDFMEDASAQGAPWFCYLASPDPHSPLSVAPEDQFRYDFHNHPIKAQTNFAGMPSWINAAGGPTTPDDVWRYQELARQQAKECHEFDRWLEVLFDYIDNSGQREHTYIFFSSDNGMVYGEHGVNAGVIAKNDFFDVSSHVPLVASGPGILRGTSSMPALISHDVIQTIIEAAEVTPNRPQFPHRRSLVGPDSYDRHIMLTRGGSQAGSFISPCPYNGEAIVNDRYMLARYRATIGATLWGPPGPYPEVPSPTNTLEMYDRQEDPNEWVNLGNSVDAGVVAVRNTLLAKLEAMCAAP